MPTSSPAAPTPLVVSPRGQITLPQGVRARLRLAPGSVVLLREEAGKLVLDPAAVIPVEHYSDEEVPGPLDVERLTPSRLAPKDRPILAAAIAARATHFVTRDRRDFGPWMGARGGLSLAVMTPHQFLENDSLSLAGVSRRAP